MLSSALPGYQFNYFSDFLANTLRVGTDLRVYHVSTPPTATASIYASPPGKQDESTTCESHFLAISQPRAAGSADVLADIAGTNGNENTKTENHVLVFGIEVLIFTTNSLTTIFVSKADSSGFLTRPIHSTQASSSIIRTVTSAFLEWLVRRNLSPRPPEPSNVTRHEVGPHDAVNDSTSDIKPASVPDRTSGRRRLVLSLFARSQNQYLFPGSVENKTKHVLDDRQLIKWWCRVIDGLVEREWPAHGYTDPVVTLSTSAAETRIDGSGTSAAVQDTTSPPTSVNATATTAATANIQPQAYIIVPGCDRSETVRSFFPPSARYPRPGAPPRWHNSYPGQFLVGTDTWQSASDTPTAVPVRCMIPRLPDDPKARYCEDLDHAGTDELGRWRDIRSLQQFWETMEYRQECAAGRLVGFIWVVFDTRNIPVKAANGLTPVINKPDVEQSNDHPQPAKSDIAPPIALNSNSDSTTAQPAPAQTPPTILLSPPQYNTLATFLNHTDFAGPTLARTSTQAWIAKAKALSGAAKFGVDVEGRARADSGVAMMQGTNTETEPGVIGIGQKHARDEDEVEADASRAKPKVNVNILTGIRKKRKVEVEGSSAVLNGDGSTTAGGSGSDVSVSVAGADDKTEMLRGTDVDVDAANSGGVRTLSAGLVRKKRKGSPSPSAL